MASPQELVQWLPETLPEDFSEWDGEASPATLPGTPGGLKPAHGNAEASKPPGPAEREAILASVLDRARDARSASSASDYFKPQKLSSAMVDKLPTRAAHKTESRKPTDDAPAASGWSNVTPVERIRSTPELPTTGRHESDEALSELFSSHIEDAGEQQTARKKWMIVAAVSACAILLLLFVIIPMSHRGTKSVAKQPVQPLPAAAITQQMTSTQTPSAREPLTQEKPQATAVTHPATITQPTNEQPAANSARVQPNMMNDQLTAPTRIPQDMKKQAAENAPPPVNFGADGLGGSGASDGVFNGQSQRIVQAKPVAISAGIATGLLIQKTMPNYPAIAKAAKVTGTVVLQATISKTGTIKDLHVANGPAMLRQAALDAVRNWRYKPYRLNNEPVEVETTVNVIFSIGN